MANGAAFISQIRRNRWCSSGTMTVNRRQFLAAFPAACFASRGEASSEPFPIFVSDAQQVAYRFRRREVDYDGGEAVGTIVVDPRKKYLYLVLEGSRAIRYGVGVGRAGFAWSGEAVIGRKAKWPKWTPTPEQMARSRIYARWADGMPGGSDNPLGARALYLFRDGADTFYRIHGTETPSTIGHAVSSGCIRMINMDVAHLYERVDVGTRVVVLAG